MGQFKIQPCRTPGPTQKPTLYDLVWAAGIYEGDGCVASTHAGAATQVMLSQKDGWLPNRLRDLFGGTVRKVAGSSNFVNQYDHYIWSIAGRRARGFLQTIYGLLSPRRQKQICREMRLGEYNGV